MVHISSNFNKYIGGRRRRNSKRKFSLALTEQMNNKEEKELTYRAPVQTII